MVKKCKNCACESKVAKNSDFIDVDKVVADAKEGIKKLFSAEGLESAHEKRMAELAYERENQRLEFEHQKELLLLAKKIKNG